MKKQANYTERKSLRLSPRDAYILAESGYKPREAIEYFIRIFCSTETKGLKIELLNLEKKLKEQELEVVKTKEEIRIIKEAIDNKEQTRFNNDSSENNVLDTSPKTVNQCLNKIEKHLKNYKRKEGIKSVKELPEDLFIALSQRGDIEVEEFKKIAFEKFK